MGYKQYLHRALGGLSRSHSDLSGNITADKRFQAKALHPNCCLRNNFFYPQNVK